MHTYIKSNLRVFKKKVVTSVQVFHFSSKVLVSVNEYITWWQYQLYMYLLCHILPVSLSFVPICKSILREKYFDVRRWWLPSAKRCAFSFISIKTFSSIRFNLYLSNMPWNFPYCTKFSLLYDAGVQRFLPKY